MAVYRGLEDEIQTAGAAYSTQDCIEKLFLWIKGDKETRTEKQQRLIQFGYMCKKMLVNVVFFYKRVTDYAINRFPKFDYRIECSIIF